VSGSIDFRPLFGGRRPGRFNPSQDHAWTPQMAPAGLDHVEPQGFIADGVIGADQIIAGSIQTEHLAVGAVTEVENVGSTVIIDATGITIKDQHDVVGLTAAGFSKSWFDFISFGLYNARFESGTNGVLANGLTDALPYWTVAQQTNTPTISYVSADKAVKVQSASTLGDVGEFKSVLIPVQPGAQIQVRVRVKTNVVAAGWTINVHLEQYQADGTTALATLGLLTQSGSTHSPSAYLPFTGSPVTTDTDVVYGKVRVRLAPGANTSNWMELADVAVYYVTEDLAGLDVAASTFTASTSMDTPDIRADEVTLGTSIDLNEGATGRLDITTPETAVDLRVVINAPSGQDPAIILGENGTLDARIRRTGAKALNIEANGTDDLVVSIGGDLNVSDAVAATGAITGASLDVSGEVEAAQYQVSAFITPTALSADVNDYNPTGGGTAGFWRLSSDATPRTITGIVGPAHVDGMLLYLFNLNGSTSITIANQSASSTSVNRIICPGGANLTLRAGGGVLLMYDLTTQRWRVVQP
jgi:hypothetical protein